MKSSNKYKVIGIMSGSSLDGLDIVCCDYSHTKKGWQYTMLDGVTKIYNASWRKKLTQAHTLSGLDLVSLDYEYGRFIGKSCANALRNMKIDSVAIIASHGHTIFHQPSAGITYQLGNGHAIYAETGITVVNDFRALDVMFGGEGAPLTPLGDDLLFSNYEVCLNLGGIANLSTKKRNKRIAQDICFANMGLNYLAEKRGKHYDRHGKIASAGVLDKKLLNKLIEVYKKRGKRKYSLGREQFEQDIKPVLDTSNTTLDNVMATFCESICLAIDQCIERQPTKIKILTTGGGALNHFLIHRLQNRMITKATIVIPNNNLIMFKEAIIFGLLGVLRIQGNTNVLKSVTQSHRDSSTGYIIGGHF